MPTSVGYQDLAALVAHERGASADWHLIASPFGTIEAAPFSYTRPIDATIPEPITLHQVNFDPRSLDAFSWKIDEPLNAPHARSMEYPSVNRANKGDRLPAAKAAPAPINPASLPPLQPVSAPVAPDAQPATPPEIAPQPSKSDEHAEQGDTVPLVVQTGVHKDVSKALAPAAAIPEEDSALSDKPPEIPMAAASQAPPSLETMSFLGNDDGQRSAQVYFGSGVMGAPEGLQSWAPGAEPILAGPSEDSGIKLSALEGADYDADEAGGETVVSKGDPRLMLTPAQRLGLVGKPRARAEKCIADAVYFEARGEPLKGQQAVAQVVVNRVFSGFYPHDVCGVVYQNADRHLACQFTFACEGKDLSKIDEPDMWEQAKRIAKEALDGKIWLADVGHATHYHAYWVHPSWVHEMVRLYKFGVHTFYRPRNWGDGEDDWGPTEVKAEMLRPDPEALSEKPVTPARVESAKGREASIDKNESIAKL